MFIIVAGAGLIGSEIVPMLVENHHDVVVIDIDREVCEQVHAETGALTVHGSATDIRVLDEAGAGKADVVLCLMRLDADNIACALLARSLGVERTIVRMRNPRYEQAYRKAGVPRYEQAYRKAGVTTIVRVADLLLNQIMTEIEQPVVRTIMRLGGGKAAIYAVNIPPGALCIGTSIRQVAKHPDSPSTPTSPPSACSWGSTTRATTTSSSREATTSSKRTTPPSSSPRASSSSRPPTSSGGRSDVAAAPPRKRS